ncbi:hypothetical protein BX616_003347 [Lobosporangium transversale]|uniref:Crinkler effector protein N-terminal domain-containing protein n=1 Tax=Lobosporangium transversale TaxID=64571 RepID=A0A1Y2G6J8_9FUNG|nr:hypothetical protein BCR41DRAFT_365294 [Lobosporangium transversale]KAF9899028.1 hypothetical protein BX616_003347 [Lobosporangium transversale]ORY94347.1 hypothetical protein BCR41DRAFT_365294 [Lobosporangium transversale]|eukprot:XP_021875287.1 hypothetical protein BCR41DRAFT_365294 [Lobosporangium transversale]
MENQPQTRFREIDPTKTVDGLKKHIKAEKTPRFDDVAADELTLWRVSHPVIAANKHQPILLSLVQQRIEGIT